MRPLDRLPMKRTGSRSSIVGPAVTSTRRPASVAPRPQQGLGSRRRSPRFGEAARPDPAAGEVSGAGSHEAHASRAEQVDVPLDCRMLPHVGIHRRREQHRRARRQVERGEEIVGDAVGELADDVRRGRGDEQKLHARGQRDVFDVRVERPARTGSVITGWRVIASKVSGPTKRRAARVITACTSWPRFCSSRATSTAL